MKKVLLVCGLGVVAWSSAIAAGEACAAQNAAAYILWVAISIVSIDVLILKALL